MSSGGAGGAESGGGGGGGGSYTTLPSCSLCLKTRVPNSIALTSKCDCDDYDELAKTGAVVGLLLRLCQPDYRAFRRLAEAPLVSALVVSAHPFRGLECRPASPYAHALAVAHSHICVSRPCMDFLPVPVTPRLLHSCPPTALWPPPHTPAHVEAPHRTRCPRLDSVVCAGAQLTSCRQCNKLAFSLHKIALPPEAAGTPRPLDSS